MKSPSRNITIIVAFIILLSSCESKHHHHHQEELSLEDTSSIFYSIELQRIEFPTESISLRTNRIQEILTQYGLTVSISDRLDPDREVDWCILPKPTMEDVMRFTCGVRGIRWKMVPGGIEFHDAESTKNSNAVREYDPEDPFGPPKNNDTQSITGKSPDREYDSDDPFRPPPKK